MVGGSRGALPLPLRGDGVVPSGSSGQSVRRRCSARRGRPLLPGASRLWAAARRGMGSFPGGIPHCTENSRHGGAGASKGSYPIALEFPRLMPTKENVTRRVGRL